MNYLQYLENIWITYNKVLCLIKCQVSLLWVDLYQLDENTYYLNGIALIDSFLGL